MPTPSGGGVEGNARACWGFLLSQDSWGFEGAHVAPSGPKGGRFYLWRPMSNAVNASGLLEALDQVLEDRKSQDPSQSYVAKLYHKGLPKILEKIEEESRETIEAASEEGTDHLVYEVGDLWFHTLVLLHHKGRTGADVLQELARRFGVSGIVEKASRPPKE
jgi:phosphoribosyl-ATP pyrophosphohydrolase